MLKRMSMDWLHYPVSQALVGLHNLLAPVTGSSSGVTWALMIVLLAAGIRVVLLPFHLKQWNAQQRLASAQPKVREANTRFQERIRELTSDKGLGDEERKRLVGEEQARHVQTIRRVGQEGGVKWRNIFIPILVQGLAGILLFHVMRSFRSGGEPRYGIPDDVYQAAVEAEVMGAPISVSATTRAAEILGLDAVPLTVRMVALGLIALITLASIVSYRESLRKSRKIAGGDEKPSADPLEEKVAQGVKKLPYVLFGFLAILYLLLPVGLLLAALTTTVWMAVYQQILLRRMRQQNAAPLEGEDTRAA